MQSAAALQRPRRQAGARITVEWSSTTATTANNARRRESYASLVSAGRRSGWKAPPNFYGGAACPLETAKLPVRYPQKRGGRRRHRERFADLPREEFRSNAMSRDGFRP
jgi:hypothetical protein